MPAPTLHRAVAASAPADLLDGIVHPATVLNARPGAMLVRVDTGSVSRCVCLLAVGHSSGADLTTGLLLGLRVAAPGRSTLAGSSVGSSSRTRRGGQREAQ